jgi:hypothetical protein
MNSIFTLAPDEGGREQQSGTTQVHATASHTVRSRKMQLWRDDKPFNQGFQLTFPSRETS